MVDDRDGQDRDEDDDDGLEDGPSVAVYVEVGGGGGEAGGPRTVYAGASVDPRKRMGKRLSEARLGRDMARVSRHYRRLDPATLRLRVVARFRFRAGDEAGYRRADARAREVEKALIAALHVVCGDREDLVLLNTTRGGENGPRGGGGGRWLPGRR